jgi:RNA polymerase sigma-70 factor (ECF subfamily)
MAIDGDIMQSMYDQYSDQIYRFLAWQTGDSILAEDLTSEVFLRAWKNKDKLAPDEQKAWLYRVARNLTTDYWRKKKPTPLDEQEEVVFDHNLHEEAAQREEVEQLQKLVTGMKDEFKTVLTLRLFEQLAYAEISNIMGKTEGNIRVLYYRALKELRNQYEQLA